MVNMHGWIITLLERGAGRILAAFISFLDCGWVLWASSPERLACVSFLQSLLFFSLLKSYSFLLSHSKQVVSSWPEWYRSWGLTQSTRNSWQFFGSSQQKEQGGFFPFCQVFGPCPPLLPLAMSSLWNLLLSAHPSSLNSLIQLNLQVYKELPSVIWIWTFCSVKLWGAVK